MQIGASMGHKHVRKRNPLTFIRPASASGAVSIKLLIGVGSSTNAVVVIDGRHCQSAVRDLTASGIDVYAFDRASLAGLEITVLVAKERSSCRSRSGDCCIRRIGAGVGNRYYQGSNKGLSCISHIQSLQKV